MATLLQDLKYFLFSVYINSVESACKIVVERISQFDRRRKEEEERDNRKGRWFIFKCVNCIIAQSAMH